MNLTLKNSIRDCAQFIADSFNNIVITFISFLRIIVLSSPKLMFCFKKIRKERRCNKCTVLANGPSLKSALDNKEVVIDNSDLICVNMFCNSTYFWDLKPHFYCLVDDQFFKHTIDRCRKQVSQLSEAFSKVDWDMCLVISTSSGNGGVLKDLDNPNIKIIRINTTTVGGFKWFRHFVFQFRMGMPKCQTVTNMALSAAILMGYKEIYLYGADHSWTKDLFVDDDNICCYGDRHVYNTDLEVIKLDYNIASLLREYANMFESHYYINEYAKNVGCRILNCTKNSFVDAYERYLN